MIRNANLLILERVPKYPLVLWTIDMQIDLPVAVEQIQFENYKEYESFGGRQKYQKNSLSSVDQFIKTVNDNLATEIPKLLVNQKVLEIFKDRWIHNVEDLIEENSFHLEIIKDSPGFSLGNHLDNQFIIGNLIFNLVDNNDGTKFHEPGSGKLLFEGPKEKNKGVFFLNLPGALHSFKNTSNRDRYMLNSYWIIKK